MMSELAAKILRERNMTFATSPHEPPTPFHSQNEIALAEQLTAANARVAELEDKTNNLSLLVVRLARRVRVFEKGSDVATKALDYLVRSGLMPSVLRNEKQ